MLLSLTIKNIALIDNLTVDLFGGFNVLTGETGAGKSLIVDSLALLLGEKADRGLISYGETFASVEAVFETDLPEVLDKLEEFGLERENQIIISRKLSLDGKNECRVNGKSFTLSMLKALTSPLMDLHGQFEHQELLKETYQLFTLDELGGSEILKAKNEYKDAFLKLKQVTNELNSLGFDSKDRERLLDLYSYQIKEIEDANFQVGEEEQLKEFRSMVLNQEKIASSISRLETFFEGGGGAMGLVELSKKCDLELSEVARFLPEQSELSSRMSSLKYEIIDLAESVSAIGKSLEFDEYSAKENEERLDTLSLLKKKYGATVEEINEYLKNAKTEYERLLNSAETMARLEAEKVQFRSILDEKALVLSHLRKKIAENFKQKLVLELEELAMKNAEFDIIFDTDFRNATELGYDKIQFMFSANSGQPMRPLSKVASGGEMSRFMLAVKNLTADTDRIGTMVFDEIDSGISGETANLLAKKLAKIGERHQVICVTHLPQVASFGNVHFFISKTNNGKVKTTIERLSGERRVQEIARLIGGTVSEFSLSHARLMLEEGKAK